MTQMVYRTRNYQESLSSIRSLFLLMLILPLPALILGAAIMYAQKPPLHVIALIVLGLAGFLILLLLLPWLYYRGFRNLTFTLDDAGLTVRFLRTLHIPWSEVISAEKVRPGAIVGMRLCGLGWSVTHGLFSTKLGRAWLWLAGESEAIFLKTQKRNYLIAPENIDEFMHTVESRIGR